MMDKHGTHAHGHADPHGVGHGDAHDDGRVHAHISSLKFLIAIFAALIFLTFVTVKVSYYDFGSANTIIAVAVATVKASLVAVFFMHLRHDKGFHGLIFVMAFVFLGVFLILTLDDIGTRGRVDEATGVRVLPRTGQEAPGMEVSPFWQRHAADGGAPNAASGHGATGGGGGGASGNQAGGAGSGAGAGAAGAGAGAQH